MEALSARRRAFSRDREARRRLLSRSSIATRLTGSARKYAETIELDQIRRSTDEDKDTREGMTASVKYLLRSLERAMGMEDATKKRQVQEFFEKRLHRRPGQPMAKWVNVFEKAVLDMKAEGLTVELKSVGWLLFEKSSMTLERQERVLGAAEGEFEFAAIRRALIKLFPDTMISQEKQSAPDRKPGHVTDRRQNDRCKSRFRKPRHGKTGRYTAHETDAQDAEEDPNSEKEESCEEESDLTTALHVALTATVLDTGPVIRFVRQETNTMRRHILQVVL